jgi:hypothetical protein
MLPATLVGLTNVVIRGAGRAPSGLSSQEWVPAGGKGTPAASRKKERAR